MTHTGRFAYLDGLRAVAILAVLGVHWFSSYVPFFRGGVIGVDIFFVLSGFIITTVLWRSSSTASRRSQWWHFVRRRVVRLYPALVGLVAGSVLLYAAVPTSGLSPAQVAERGWLTLAQATSIWGPLQDNDLLAPTLNPFSHTWSLAVEWYFYLVWPLLLFTVKRHGWTARRAAQVSAGIGACCYLGSLALSPYWFYFGPSARFAELLAGCALALYLLSRPTDAGPMRMPPLATPIALVAIVLYVVLAPPNPEVHLALVGVPVAVAGTLVLICAGYSADGGAMHALLSHRVPTFIGRLSYSLYLWHMTPILALATVPGVPRPVLALLALTLVAALTLSSFYLLERPFLRARSDVLSPAPLFASSPGTAQVPQPRDVAH
ncbi:acyltransferase family protein, partial [Nocardioides massiliensis]